jgi:hypothetical protein
VIELDLTSYFHKGYTIADLGNEADGILEDLRKQNWVESNNLLKPEWDKHSHLNKPTDYLYDAVRDFSQSGYYSWFTKIYGGFTQRTIMARKWTGQNTDWFNESRLGSFNANILFVGEGDPSIMLEIGNVDCDEDGRISGEVESLEAIYPKHGRLVTLYNINPCVVRRFLGKPSHGEWYTLHFYLGFIENTLLREVAGVSLI